MTPMLVAMLMPPQQQAFNPGTEAGGLAESIGAICLQLLLPFALGHLSRPWTSTWVNQHKAILSNLDRSSILLVVYTAFSAAVVQGLWSRTTWLDILLLSLVCLGLLLFVLVATWRLGRWLGLKREDTIVLLFCGSKKSLATGVPIAGAMFQAIDVGLMILPLMVYHQIQLIVCAIIASKLHEEISPELPS
jgi:sodium/bile acid cotransporter 7